MNTFRSIPDPLLQSVTASAAHLPSLAAREARQFGESRLRHLRAAAGGLVVLLGCLTIWRGAHQLSATRNARPAFTSFPPAAIQRTPAASAEFVIARTAGQSSTSPVPLPPVSSEAQRKVILAAGELPLLLVKDDSGRVTRIHVIER